MIGAASGCGSESTADLLGLRRARSRAGRQLRYGDVLGPDRALTIPATEIPRMNPETHRSREIRLVFAREGLRAAGIAIATVRRIISGVRCACHARARASCRKENNARTRTRGRGTECARAKPTGSARRIGQRSR